MLIDTRRESAVVADALTRISDRGVAVEPWLADGQSSTDQPLDHPVLYLVDPDADPPRWWGELEDWVRLPVATEDLYERAERLLHRAWRAGAVPIEVTDHDVLYLGRSLTILSPIEARLLRLMLQHRGQVVRRAEAAAVAWPEGAPGHHRAIDSRMRDLRKRLAEVPLQIRTVHGRGFALEWDPDAAAPPRRGIGPGRADQR